MTVARPRLVAFALAAGLLLLACGEAPSDKHVIEEPAQVDENGRITLTEQAAARLDIRTEPVQDREGRPTVPSSAVVVGPEGEHWVYTSPQPLVYLRATIGIDREEGGLAFLAEGPSPGTEVVTVGVAELYGIEFGIGK